MACAICHRMSRNYVIDALCRQPTPRFSREGRVVAPEPPSSPLFQTVGSHYGVWIYGVDSKYMLACRARVLEGRCGSCAGSRWGVLLRTWTGRGGGSRRRRGCAVDIPRRGGAVDVVTPRLWTIRLSWPRQQPRNIQLAAATAPRLASKESRASDPPKQVPRGQGLVFHGLVGDGRAHEARPRGFESSDPDGARGAAAARAARAERAHAAHRLHAAAARARARACEDVVLRRAEGRVQGRDATEAQAAG